MFAFVCLGDRSPRFFVPSSHQDKEVQSVRKLVPYKIVEGQDGAAWVEVQGNKMSPSQVRSWSPLVFFARSKNGNCRSCEGKIVSCRTAVYPVGESNIRLAFNFAASSRRFCAVLTYAFLKCCLRLEQAADVLPSWKRESDHGHSTLKNRAGPPEYPYQLISKDGVDESHSFFQVKI